MLFFKRLNVRFWHKADTQSNRGTYVLFQQGEVVGDTPSLELTYTHINVVLPPLSFPKFWRQAIIEKLAKKLG